MLNIIYEDNYLLVLNKPAGLQVEADKFGNPSLENQVRSYLDKAYPWKKQLITGIVHRLDRPVSGVIIFALTPMALKKVRGSFELGMVRKNYLAILEKCPTEKKGELVHWLRKDNAEKKAIVENPHSKGAKLAKLKYSVLMTNSIGTLADIELGTGRYHQIRAQFGALGCPVYGDKKYGAIHDSGNHGIWLHSHKMAIEHPKDGKMMTFLSPPPPTEEWASFSDYTQ